MPAAVPDLGRTRGKRHQGARRAAVEPRETDGAPRGDAVNEMQPVTQELRREWIVWIHGRYRRDLTAACGHADQTAENPSEHDVVVDAPCRAASGRHVAGDGLCHAGHHAQLLQAVCGEEPNPLTVGRPEGRAGAFRAG